MPCPLLRNDRNEWVQTVQKHSGSSASAVLVVVDVAVSMRRHVPVLPGGGSDQSIDKVVDCVCAGFFRRLTHFSHPSEGSACPFFSPRALTAVSARGLRGCWSRQEFCSRVTRGCQLVRSVVWTYTLRLRQSASETTTTTLPGTLASCRGPESSAASSLQMWAAGW